MNSPIESYSGYIEIVQGNSSHTLLKHAEYHDFKHYLNLIQFRRQNWSIEMLSG